MKKQESMLEGSLWNKLIYFALPLAASSTLQQLFNTADTAIVGRFAGSNALAAVGANAVVVTLFINALTGLSVGANVVIAQYIGAHREDRIQNAVHTTILFSVLGGILIGGIGLLCAGPLLTIMGTPDTILKDAIIYLRLYLLGLPFISLFNFGSAIVRSNGNTKAPMYCLMASGVLNLLLNLLFVIGFKMAVSGVALATTISNILAALMIVYMLTKEDGYLHLDITKLKIHKEPLMQILKTGTPASIQGMVFSIANISIQTGLNSFGATAVAGNATERNFEMISFFLCSAYNQTAVTFIGQNYAAKKYDRCKKIWKLCLLESAVSMLCVDIIFYLARYPLISLFTTDPEVISYALTKFTICLLPHFILVSYEITASVLRGMGYSLQPTIITILGSVGFRVLWLFTVFRKWHTFTVLYLVYPASWILTGTMMLILYYFASKKAYQS